MFFLLVLSVLCMSQTIEQKCIEKPIYELSENGKGKIVGSIEVKEQGKRINSYNQRETIAQYLQKYEYISLYICLL